MIIQDKYPDYIDKEKAGAYLKTIQKIGIGICVIAGISILICALIKIWIGVGISFAIFFTGSIVFEIAKRKTTIRCSSCGFKIKQLLNLMLLLVFALLLSSCISISSRLGTDRINRPYEPTLYDLDALGDVFSNDAMTQGLAGMYSPIFLIDLPFSFTVDTVMLPFDLWDLQYEKTERKRVTSYVDWFSPSDFKNTSEWVNSKDGMLSLRIATKKKKYGIEERVYIRIELKNNSIQKIWINSITNTFPQCSNGIKIIGANKIVYQGDLCDIWPYPQEISKKEMAYEVIAINIEDWKGFNSKGEYTISYTFSSLEAETDKILWTGQIESSSIEIEKK